MDSIFCWFLKRAPNPSPTLYIFGWWPQFSWLSFLQKVGLIFFPFESGLDVTSWTSGIQWTHEPQRAGGFYLHLLEPWHTNKMFDDSSGKTTWSCSETTKGQEHSAVKRMVMTQPFHMPGRVWSHSQFLITPWGHLSISILLAGTLRHRKVIYITQDHTTVKCRSQNLDSGSLVPGSVLFVATLNWSYCPNC